MNQPNHIKILRLEVSIVHLRMYEQAYALVNGGTAAPTALHANIVP